jgi:hypothetical protein
MAAFILASFDLISVLACGDEGKGERRTGRFPRQRQIIFRKVKQRAAPRRRSTAPARGAGVEGVGGAAPSLLSAAASAGEHGVAAEGAAKQDLFSLAPPRALLARLRDHERSRRFRR